MATLADQMAADAIGVFLRTSAFGETVTYVKGGGATRDIIAVVDRQLPQPMAGENRAVRPVYRVALANDATEGISASELETSTDTLMFGRRVGGTVETFRINRVETQDEGILVLECR